MLENSALSRRSLLRLAALGVGSLALSACAADTRPTTVLRPPTPTAVPTPSAGTTRRFALRPAAARLDLGGPVVDTWAYDNVLPGKEIRVQRGDVIEVAVTNALPSETTVHWHGIALPNAMDGMPGVTQPAIGANGGTFTYRFPADTAGTYWLHPHTGLQLDRGLYAPLIVEDPDDPAVDADWVVVLDDWLDGIDGATPDSVYAKLRNSPASHDDMDHMDMGGLGGDVTYPHYLVNGRVPEAPVSFTARPGDRVRIRFINAAADTAFRVALAGHRVNVTHTDGYPVQPVQADCVQIGMGERYDVIVTLGDGVFPLVAAAESKDGLARALIRTGSGSPPDDGFRPAELTRPPITARDLRPRDDVRLAERDPDRVLEVRLAGGMGGYNWTIDGAPFEHADALTIRQGERVRLRFTNDSMMWHPMHIHGHTLAVSPSGVRKDTVAVLPMRTVIAEFDANNPGQWMLHCHNAYHLEAGMMRTVSYATGFTPGPR